MPNDDKRGFSLDLHFSSLADFIAFVAVIRNQELDLSKLVETTRQLSERAKALDQAIDDAPHT